MDEENRVQRLKAQEMVQKREKETIENEILVVSKSEEEMCDIEKLRSEKRAIIQEEKRLRSLLALEMSNLHRKEDLSAAKLAERRRKALIKESKRVQRLQEEETQRRRYQKLLKEKHGIIA